MKFLSICALSVALMFSTLSCTSNHLITDEAERAAVQADFDKRAASWNHHSSECQMMVSGKRNGTNKPPSLP